MNLTPREHEVMALLIEGASDKELANKLDVAYGTIKAHMRSIFEKLCAKNRAHAAVIYVRLSPDTQKMYDASAFNPLSNA